MTPLVPCYFCGRSATLDDKGMQRVHYPSNTEIRPCNASWKKPRQTTYPFDELEVTS